MEDVQSVCIVTDSVSDIPPELVSELGIRVVPLTVTIAGQTFVDGDITIDEFFERMTAAPELPKTSQPSVGEFEDAFRRCLERFSEVVCITISNRLSGTRESALEAARLVGERVHVLDSLTLSWAEGYQVVEAARAAARGESAAQIEAGFEELRGNVHLVVGLDSLDNLAKGGRIGKVSAFLGGFLNLKVLLTVADDGAFEPVARVRGAKAGLQATVDWVAEAVDEKRPAVFAVQHAQSPENAAWLEQAIRTRFNVADLTIVPAGAVISAHTGTGWGVVAVQTD
jgi:DegV family protein with EDD domain